ncbi:shikimate dehydrogenase [Candidatus Woesearchaeota archaeon]|nr:shikimate dehydrogenase [Candidatus Woesearchaeota archaeon]
MLAAVVLEKTAEKAMKAAERCKKADLIELRLDSIRDLGPATLKELIEKCGKPVIATNRKSNEGGFFRGNEKKRVGLLKTAIDLGADYADIEYSSQASSKFLIKNKKNTKIIVSYHNFKETPDSIKKTYGNIKSLNPDLIKIVTRANSAADNFRIFDLINKANDEKRKIVAFCMGHYGQFGRILGIILGSKIAYASIEEGNESASGQLTLNELISHYKLRKLNKNTKIAGLIGNPVAHSWSHIMHNEGFDKLRINAVYLKFQVDKLREFIDYFKNLNSLGFSVTIPYKIEVMKYLDKIDEKAEEIGAVNTIVMRNKKLIGYNTDCQGAVMALKEKVSLKGKRAVLLGAGGSTRAIAYGLMEENMNNITILNRTIKKAKDIANDFGCGYGSLSDLKNVDYDMLINTTSVGMHPNADESIIPSNLIKKNSVVFDIVFNPSKTRLLKDAEKKSCTIIPGFEMLVQGAMLQFRLWTSKNAPEKAMKRKVLDYLKNAGNKN